MFLYSKFKGCHWQDYSSSKKLKYLQALEIKMAKKQGRSPLPVVVNYTLDHDILGCFSVVDGEKFLYINEILITEHHLRFMALATILHEGRHAYQFQVARASKIPWYKFSAKRWKKNFQGYFTASDDETIYSMQAVERDAQEFAIDTLKSLSFKYSNEKDYQATLDFLQDDYIQKRFDAKKKFGSSYEKAINKNIDHRSRNN